MVGKTKLLNRYSLWIYLRVKNFSRRRVSFTIFWALSPQVIPGSPRNIRKNSPWLTTGREKAPFCNTPEHSFHLIKICPQENQLINQGLTFWDFKRTYISREEGNTQLQPTRAILSYLKHSEKTNRKHYLSAKHRGTGSIKAET